MSAPRGKYTQWAPPPAARIPPFLLARDGDELVLIAPFARRRRGPTQAEAAIVTTVAGHLRTLSPVRGPVWIDPHDGHVTPAAIGEGQLRRRLVDCASFGVRLA